MFIIFATTLLESRFLVCLTSLRFFCVQVRRSQDLLYFPRDVRQDAGVCGPAGGAQHHRHPDGHQKCNRKAGRRREAMFYSEHAHTVLDLVLASKKEASEVRM